MIIVKLTGYSSSLSLFVFIVSLIDKTLIITLSFSYKTFITIVSFDYNPIKIC